MLSREIAFFMFEDLEADDYTELLGEIWLALQHPEITITRFWIGGEGHGIIKEQCNTILANRIRALNPDVSITVLKGLGRNAGSQASYKKEGAALGVDKAEIQEALKKDTRFPENEDEQKEVINALYEKIEEQYKQGRRLCFICSKPPTELLKLIEWYPQVKKCLKAAELIIYPSYNTRDPWECAKKQGEAERIVYENAIDRLFAAFGKVSFAESKMLLSSNNSAIDSTRHSEIFNTIRNAPKSHSSVLHPLIDMMNHWTEHLIARFREDWQKTCAPLEDFFKKVNKEEPAQLIQQLGEWVNKRNFRDLTEEEKQKFKAAYQFMDHLRSTSEEKKQLRNWVIDKVCDELDNKQYSTELIEEVRCELKTDNPENLSTSQLEEKPTNDAKSQLKQLLLKKIDGDKNKDKGELEKIQYAIFRVYRILRAWQNTTKAELNILLADQLLLFHILFLFDNHANKTKEYSCHSKPCKVKFNKQGELEYSDAASEEKTNLEVLIPKSIPTLTDFNKLMHASKQENPAEEQKIQSKELEKAQQSVFDDLYGILKNTVDYYADLENKKTLAHKNSSEVISTISQSELVQPVPKTCHFYSFLSRQASSPFLADLTNQAKKINRRLIS